MCTRGRGEEGQIGPPFIANNGASVAVIGSGVPQVAVYLSADLRLPRRMTIEAEKDTSSSPLMATLQRERDRERERVAPKSFPRRLRQGAISLTLVKHICSTYLLKCRHCSFKADRTRAIESILTSAEDFSAGW